MYAAQPYYQSSTYPTQSEKPQWTVAAPNRVVQATEKELPLPSAWQVLRPKDRADRVKETVAAVARGETTISEDELLASVPLPSKLTANNFSFPKSKLKLDYTYSVFDRLYAQSADEKDTRDIEMEREMDSSMTAVEKWIKEMAVPFEPEAAAT